MHDDYGVPQSGERIRGNDKAWTVYENYPGIPDLIDYSYRLDGDLAVVEMILDYDEKGYEGGALLSRDSPALLAGSAGLFGHAKPTQSYPLVVVPVLAVVVVVADFGDDRGLSYWQAAREQLGVKRLVQRFGRLGGQLGVDVPQHDPLGADLRAFGSAQPKWSHSEIL